MNKSKKLADELFPDGPDEDLAVLDIPPNERRLHTETFDFSISTIYEYLGRGDIFIPEFQRKYVWNKSQASRLIESLIIQCPIPVVYFNQEQSERLSVIDGNQRLTSIKLFLDNDFELKGLTAYPELEGSKFSDLDPRIRRHILNRTLRCITILKETHPQIKFDVFERLNTGSVRLNYQEIRHGIYHGPLMKLIDELVVEKSWKEVSGIHKDTRMRSAELILRYFALSDMLSEYRKPMSTFLNSFCIKYSRIDAESSGVLKEKFLSNLEIAKTIFGSLVFRTFDANRQPLSKSMNAAIFDSVMVALDDLKVSKRKVMTRDNEPLIDEFYNLLQDKKFSEYISVGTSATLAVKSRIRLVKSLFSKHLK